MKTKFFLLFLIGLSIFSISSGVEKVSEKAKTGLSTTNKYVIPTQVQDKLYPINVANVKLGGEIGRRIDVTMNNNIKKLDLNKNFISHFQQKLGPGAVGGAFIGMGMLIDACVRFAAYSHDPEMVLLKDNLIDKIINLQLNDGYSGFYKEDKRLWSGWDIHEMAFIIDGLISNYELFGDVRSLNSAIKTADLILSHWNEMPVDFAKTVDMHVLVTGIDWAILKLYRVTGEKRFLDFSEIQKPLTDWNTKIAIGRRLGVSGHMFAYFAMCQSQLEFYRLFPNEKLLKQTENALTFLTANDGLTITGSAGIREIWTDDQDGDGELGETCATAYQIRIFENLLRLYGDSKYGDLIERTVFNGLFAAQSPDGNKIRYYTPFEGDRHYYQHEYMCCPGNYRRIISELPSLIFYNLPKNGIAINIYTPCTATMELLNKTKVTLRQETDYPNSGKVEIYVSPSKATKFNLLLRIPAWAKNSKVTINGAEWDERAEPGSFLRINREWSENDRVTINMPMDWRLVNGRKRQAGRVAIMRGPVIYGFNPEANPEATLNGARKFDDLKRLLIDASTLSTPLVSNSIRPNGLVGEISGWRENFSGLANGKPEFKLKLTEFADPDQKIIYFKVPDYSIAVEDELINGSGIITKKKKIDRKLTNN